MLSAVYDYKTPLLNLASELSAKGELGEAVFLLRRLVEHYPTLPEAYIRLAEALSAYGLTAEAEDAALRACALDPDDQDSFIAYCHLLVAHGNRSSAVTKLRSAIESQPLWWRARAELGTVLLGLGQLEESETLLRALLDEEWTPEVAADLSQVYLRLGRTAEAQSLIARFAASGVEKEKLVALARCFVDLRLHDAAWQWIQALTTSGVVTEEILLVLRELIAGTQGEAAALELSETLLKQHSSSGLRYAALEARSALGRGPLLNASNRRIVFVSELPKVREIKLAHGLRALGWEVVLLCKNLPDCDPERFFDQTIRFNTPEEAQYIARSLGARLFHVFTNGVDDTVRSFVKDKPGFVIYDAIDVFDGMIYEPVTLMSAQRYCITHADGLVCRDLQANYVCRKSGLARTKHTIFFPEYCWNNTPKVIERDSSGIHIVQAGWVDLSGKKERKEASMFDLFEALAKIGVHVHLYKHMLFKDRDPKELYGDLYELANQFGTVHIHQTVPVDKICEELSRYHIGINLASHSIFGTRQTKHSKNYYNLALCGSARNTDYIDAGMPVMHSADLTFQKFMLRRMGVGIELTRARLADLRRYLEAFTNAGVRELIYQRREKFSLDKQTYRLAKFYELCARDNTTADFRLDVGRHEAMN